VDIPDIICIFLIAKLLSESGYLYLESWECSNSSGNIKKFKKKRDFDKLAKASLEMP